MTIKNLSSYCINGLACMLVMLLLSACNVTKHVEEGSFILRQNSIKINSEHTIKNKGQLNDNLSSLILQKRNSYALGIPYKVILYNWRYSKYQKDTSNFQIKSRTVERPVIYNGPLKQRTKANMKSYLFNQGYFYAEVYDSTTFNKKRQRAKVTYIVHTGKNYLINNVIYDVLDSTVDAIVKNAHKNSYLAKGEPFTMELLEEERTRLSNEVRKYGYYKFSNENISFVVDTFNADSVKRSATLLQNAFQFFTPNTLNKRSSLDIRTIIRATEDSSTLTRYKIGRINVLPDYVGREDFRDTTMYVSRRDSFVFRYHNYYIRENILRSHIFLLPGNYFSQEHYDNTITKLNELGVFQYVRLNLSEDTLAKEPTLRFTAIMNPTKKYDISPSVEVSNGSNYDIGAALALGFRSRNVLKGANMLNVQVSGGLESNYDTKVGEKFLQHFYLMSRNAGLNASFTFPKFVFPKGNTILSGKNKPSTIIGAGFNMLDRLNYFTLYNTSANFSYRWKETIARTWDWSPAFINVIRFPRIADSFQRRLDSSAFLRNSYKEYFILGESFSFTFSNQAEKAITEDYSYLRLGIEEAGGILSLTNPSGIVLEKPYAQYIKLDFDARHYQRLGKALAAFRFYGGIGRPYGNSPTLPYIKQYFAGGPYSIRGWRIRSLGPGATEPDSVINYIDRTGDIKLEANAEYRFPIMQLYAGTFKLNGALFADAGNIWLAKHSDEYPDGTFKFSTFGNDIAVSSGAGLRIDVGGFITLRLDAAFPLRKPYVAQNYGWVIREIDILDNKWRRDNVVVQFAIGYPF